MSEPAPETAPPMQVTQTRAVDGFLPACRQACIVALARMPDAVEAGPLRERLYPILGVAVDGSVPPGPAIGVIVQACAELQAQAGLPQFWPATCRKLGGDMWEIVLPSLQGAHVHSGSLLRRVMGVAIALLEGTDTAPLAANIQLLLEELRREAPAGKNPFLMLETAHRAGIPWRRLAGNIYALGQGRHGRWFNSTITDRTSSIGVALSRQKDLTAQLLRARGLPAPAHQFARSEADALAVAEKIGYPVVIKPSNLDRGVGVFSMLRTPKQVAAAWRSARAHSDRILVEKHFDGEDYRIYVFEGEVFRARHRIPGGVKGDGRSTVRELLDVVNADPRRGERGTFSEWIRIDLDDEAMELLEDQALTPDAIPAAGRFVRLRRIANVSVGGVPLPVEVEDIHPDNRQLAVQAVGALNLDLGAIDVIMPDIGQSWIRTGAAICEVNSQPQWAAGAPEWLYARLFPEQGRIPVVGIVADAMPRWVSAAQASAEAAGVHLGLCSSKGAWSSRGQIARGTSLGVFHACNVLVAERNIDAILMLMDASLLQRGMPVDRLDALVIGTASPTPDSKALVEVASAFAVETLQDEAGVAGRVAKIVAGDKVRT